MTQSPVPTGTLVLDSASLLRAFSLLSQVIHCDDWKPTQANAVSEYMQDMFLTWYANVRAEAERLTGLEVEASSEAEVLNQFLVKHRFPPLFGDIAPGGVGVAAIADLLVRWAAEAGVTEITRYEHKGGFRPVRHRAFVLPRQGVEYYSLPSESSPLVKLRASDGGGVWLHMANRPAHGLSLAGTAAWAMQHRFESDDNHRYSEVHVPTLEIETRADLEWMLGLASANGHFIEQAFQVFKLRLNEMGGRFRAATGLATRRGISTTPKPQPLVFNRPFIGWFTQPGSELPIGAFYAGYDSWRAPAGSLEEL